MNNLNAIGRLGRDAELKYTSSQTAVWTANVAINYGYGDNKGTTWLTVVSFGKRAEGLGKLNLTKGSQIGFSGELRVRQYDKNDGTKGMAVECVANDVTLLGSRQSDTPSQPQEQVTGGIPFDSIPF